MKKSIICAGEILWDILPAGIFLGGAPFNVACHLSVLGYDVQIASRIGQDMLGMQALGRMRELELSPDLVQIDTEYNTGTVNVTLDPKGEPSFDINYPAAWDFIQIEQDLFNAAAESDILIFGSLSQRDPTSRNTMGLLRELVPIKVFDVNLRPPYTDTGIIQNSLEGTQIVKLNEEELHELALRFGFSEDTRQAVLDMADAFGSQTICITKGESGAALYHQGMYTEHNGFRVEVKDTVGAGDAFLAGLVSGLNEGLDNIAILKRANALGAYVSSCSGATPHIDFDRLNEIMNI